MDESWRMQMGMSAAPPPPPTTTRHAANYLPRRSTEAATTSSNRRGNSISDDPLKPEDFDDVFGGPPRTVLSRQFSAGFERSASSSTSFRYEEIFRPPDKAPPPVVRSGRSLPEFRIPGQQSNGFYSDIFGWEDHERVVRSRSRSKASSSSVLSSEELSPLRPAVSGDGYDDVSFFASKLRPINVRSSWTTRRMAHEEDKQRQHNKMMPPPFSTSQPFYNTAKNSPVNFTNYSFGLNRRNASPETISLEPISNSSFRVSADDMELNSPSSPVSSVCQSPSDQKHDMEEEILTMEEDEDEDEEDDAMSSYVIEINSDINREGTCESNGVDEAIAWAKERFQMQECGTKNPTKELLNRRADSFGSVDEKEDKSASEEEAGQFELAVQTETQILDEKIRLWSNGKETDIRSLLSSLHHILWHSSGWLAVNLMNITEISQVKKAYQKARLCLHPDKLQQKGATIPQKYIATKAFSVLQDAWAAFIAQEVL